MLILDVDGVLTDGGVFLGDRGEFKRFDARDVTGIKYLKRSGIEVALVSGHESEAVARLAEQLGIENAFQKALRKWPVVRDLLEREHINPLEAVYVGDDLIDLPVMLRVGVGVAVADAEEELLGRADLVTLRPGGRGAVREVAEILLRAQGKWEPLMDRYLRVDPPRESAIP